MLHLFEARFNAALPGRPSRSCETNCPEGLLSWRFVYARNVLFYLIHSFLPERAAGSYTECMARSIVAIVAGNVLR